MNILVNLLAAAGGVSAQTQAEQKQKDQQQEGHDPFLEMKREAARSALDFVLKKIPKNSVIGIGSGSTVACFIELLAQHTHYFKGAVASSQQTELLLRQIGMPILDLNEVDVVSIYVDGADEINPHGFMIKGGGAALTREKIIANVADYFVCMVDIRKCVERLGAFALPVEVIPMAEQSVIRQISLLGGQGVRRSGCLTDNQNCIVDVKGLSFENALDLEQQMNQITGVVEHGLFAHRAADCVFVADETKVWSVVFDQQNGATLMNGDT
jgi:ribose 5-phosphate isomerase A